MKFFSLLASGCLALLLGAPAFAEEPAEGGREATELSQEGDRLSEAGKDREAYERYRRAFELVPLPSFGLRAAESLARDGRLVEAQTLYAEAARVALPPGAPPEEVAAKAQAEAERLGLLSRIPSVVIAIEGARPEEVRLTIGDAPVASTPAGARHWVNPGQVRIHGIRGGTAIEKTLSLAPGEVKRVTLTFDAAPAPVQAAAPLGSARPSSELEVRSPRGSGQRLVGYVATGVGGAALLTGSTFGLLALKDQSDLRARCPLARCPARLQSDIDAYESKKTVATIGLAAGAGLVVGGLALIFSAPTAPVESPNSARLRAYCDGHSAGIEGAF